MKRRALVATERAEQSALIEWWKLACKKYRLPEFSLYSVPNGAFLAGNGLQRAMQMNALKRSGLRPGMPDLNLDVPHASMKFHGLRIEMKRASGSRVSPEQRAVMDYLTDAGYIVALAYGFEDAKAIIERYLGAKP